MKTLPIIFLLLICITACQPMRRTWQTDHIIADTTATEAKSDVTHVIRHDTAYTHDQVHLIIHDTTYTHERIVIHYDPVTGQPIDRTEDRIIRSSRQLDSLAIRIAYLEYTIDSMREAEALAIYQARIDSLANRDTTERGKASLSFWQTVWLSFRNHLIISACAILLMLVLYFAMRPYIQKFKS